MIWFIILTTVMTNGDVYTEVRPATAPEYNTEKQCNDAGQILVDAKQIEVGTNSGKVYFVCQNISEEQIDKVLKKSNS